MECTLANIYCPNKDSILYFSQTIGELMEFKEGKVIVAGDFNLAMDLAVSSRVGRKEEYRR